MNLLPESTLLGISSVMYFVLGVVVLANNPQKRTHQALAVLSLNLMLWALGVLFIIHCRERAEAEFWIRATFMVSAFLPATYYTFIGVFPRQRFEGVRPVLTFLWAGGIVVALLGFTKWHLVKVEVFPDRPPNPQYGPAMLGLLLCISLFAVFSFFNLLGKLRSSAGVERRQIQMVMLGIFVSTTVATVTNVLAPIFHRQTETYGPDFMVFMVLIFVYAMVRYHLLDVWLIFSRTTVYAILTAFVALTFAGSVSLVRWLSSDDSGSVNFWSTVMAAVVVAVVIQPIKEKLQITLDRALLKRRYDLNRLLARISQNAAELVRLDELLRLVAEDVQKTMGVSLFRVQLIDEKDPNVLVTEYSSVPGEQGKRLYNHGALIKHMRLEPQPLVLEQILHERPVESRIQIARHLAELEAYLCVPLQNSAGLVGLLTLGQKASRDIYSADDLVIFTAVAGPLGTSIENARLYRQIEEVNLHRARILAHMRGGVIAVDTDGRVSTVNQAAQELVGPIRLGQHFSELTPELAALLGATLEQERGVSDFEMLLKRSEEEPISLAVSSSCLKTAGNEMVGAMVMLNDLTAIKRLEQKVQRADRLSSLGILAAGMAHEIKNPLVSIKTFTQLLLERYSDPDFRATFSEVVPHEVERIDSIVLRLLDFARPKAPRFATHNLRRIIDDVLALVDNEIRSSSTTVEKEFAEDYLEVYGDEQQLHQVFLNLALNAIRAMRETEGGTLRITAKYHRHHLRRGGVLPFQEGDCVQVTVSDTGCGIAKENLDRIFTPFFTTKPDGSGLGLAVVHGIVLEHGGEIDVRSTLSSGTTFTVVLPLPRGSESASAPKEKTVAAEQ
jgi:signal transduction histidine kinase